MEFIRCLNKRQSADVGYHSSNINPPNREGCVGNAGIDKNYSLDQVLALAYSCPEPKPNIVIKAGPNAKWYLKRVNLSEIEELISKQQWRDISRCTMWTIEWD